MTAESRTDPSRSDFRELKEVIKEFLNHYQYLHEKRLHKVIFYGEMYTLQNHSERLTNANFKPYDYGPYATLIRSALFDLEANDVISTEPTKHGTAYTCSIPGDISEDKQHLIRNIHQETCSMKTDELVQFAKSSTLWKSHNYDEQMDFEEYLAEEVLSEEVRSELAEMPRNPVDQSEVTSLLDE